MSKCRLQSFFFFTCLEFRELLSLSARYEFKGFLMALLVTLTCINTGDLAWVAGKIINTMTWEHFISLPGKWQLRVEDTGAFRRLLLLPLDAAGPQLMGGIIPPFCLLTQICKRKSIQCNKVKWPVLQQLDFKIVYNERLLKGNQTFVLRRNK